MKQKSRRLFTLFLSLIMLLSLTSPAMGTLAAATEQTETKTADLRVGILSDVHLGFVWNESLQTPRFKKALEAFKAMGVDAIIVAGDLQDRSGEDTLEEQKAWMEEFASTWFEVFPADSGVEPVFIYGNHDVDLIAAQYWPESLGEYTDAFIKEINGYQFVGVNNGKEDLAVVDAYIAQAAEQSQDKPFFYIQHCPLYQSVAYSDYYSSYNQSYRSYGHQNLKDHSNAVAFHGHTHVPLTDERSIWQGDDWNEGKYTAINTATINYAASYSRVSESNTTVMPMNGSTISAGQVQHGMYMTVSGSQVSIDRYSFYEDTPVKIGVTWSFDACDEENRPYTYDGRYAAAVAPVFAEDAVVTVDEVTENSLTVTFPAASLATDGNGDMIHSYLVEAVDPVTGKLAASNGILSQYHIDNSSRFSDTYTVSVSGLEQGRTYKVNVYAREFFQKKSEPLTVTVTTPGTAQPGQAGDVNGDGAINADDLTLLQAICAGTAENTQWSDVDGNCVTETADLAALENLLAGKKAVSEDPAVDVLGASTITRHWNFSGSDWSVALQSAITKGDSDVALKVASTTAAGWPFVEVLFDEPQDWSDKNILEFDTLFDTDSGWISVTLISGENLVLGNVGTSYQSATNQPYRWSGNAKTYKLADFSNVDFSAVRGIRFAYNLAAYDGRFDGVKEHAIYVDNVRPAYVPGVAVDLDMLGTAEEITNSEKVYAIGQTNGSNEAVKSDAGTMTVSLDKSYKINRYAKLYVDAKGSGSVTVQALDADGNALGQSVALKAGSKWKRNALQISDFAVAADAEVSQLCFSFTDTLYLDNMSLEPLKDNDLIGTSSITYASDSGLSCSQQSDVTNNSNSAVAAIVEDTSYGRYPTVTLSLAEAVKSDATRFTVDVEHTNVDWSFRVEFLKADGTVIGNHLTGTTEAGWHTHEFKLAEMNKDPITSSEVSQIKQVRFTMYIKSDLAIGEGVYIDNAHFISGDADLFGRNKISYTSVTGHSTGLQSAVVNNSKESVAVKVADASTYYRWPKITVDLTEAMDASMTHFTVDVEHTYADSSFRVQFYDEGGTELGNHLYSSTAQGWQTVSFKLTEMNKVAMSEGDIGKITKVVFSLYYKTGLSAGNAIYLDNAKFFAGDEDLIGSSAIAYTQMSGVIGFVQTEVTNDSGDALAFARTDAATFNKWPVATLTLAETVEGMDSFTVDVEGTYSSNTFRIKMLDEGGTQLGNHLIRTITPGWQSVSFKLSEMSEDPITEDEISKIKKVQLLLYLPDGLESGKTVYLDNAEFYAKDQDILSTTAITYQSMTSLSGGLQRKVTNGSNEAVAVAVTDAANYYRWPKLQLDLEEAVSASMTHFTVDVERTYSDYSFRVQFYDDEGNELGNHLHEGNESGWKTVSFKLTEMNKKAMSESDIGKITRIVFSLYFPEGAEVGNAIYLDNANFYAEIKTDSDLLGTSQITYAANTGLSCDMQSAVTNNSNQAVEIAVNDAENYGRWPTVTLQLAEAVNIAATHFTVDVERTYSDWNFRVQFLDADGGVLGNHLIGTGDKGWQTHKFLLSELSDDSVAESEISAIKQVRFTLYLPADLEAGNAVYIDNASFLVEEVGATDTTEAETDLLATMTFEKNTGTGYSYDLNSTEVCGDTSTRSYAFSAPAGVSSWPYSYFNFDSSVDMTGATLEFDIKFVGGRHWTRVQFIDSNNTQTAKMDYTGTGEDNVWQHVSFDLSSLSVSDVKQLRIGFDCVTNNTVDRMFYIDNMQIVYAADNAASGVSVAAVYNTDNYALTDTVTGTSTLSFNSAKGETESAQMVLTPTRGISSYRVAVTDAVSASGNVIPSSAFQIYAADYIEVTDAQNGGEDGFFPDALIPFQNYALKGGNSIAAGENQGIWINLSVDSTVVAGEYTGTAVITMNAKIIKIPVNIHIYDVNLPEQVHARSAFEIWYDYIDEGEGTGSLSMDEAYFNYLVSKRIMPASISDNLRTDIGTYVDHIAEKLAGNQKISAYGIPYGVDTSSGIKRLDSAYMTDMLTAMIEKNIALRQAGDADIDLFEKGYFYFGSICDEPREDEDSSDEELVLECDQIIADAKESLVGLLADYPDLQESLLAIPHIVTAHRYDAIDNGAHTYCPRLDYFNEADYTNEDVWWYGCLDPETPYPTYHINDELITSRVMSWMQYDYNVAGNLYWCVNYYYDRAADGSLSVRDVWNDPSPLIGQPGDGYLLYPGKDYEVYGPIGTMRIESIREGNEDYEYFWLFRQNIEQYNEENGTDYDADTLLQTFFAGLYEGMYPNTDSALFAQQRIRLLEVLEQMNTDLSAAVESLI